MSVYWLTADSCGGGAVQCCCRLSLPASQSMLARLRICLQRSMIVEGCVKLAKRIGGARAMLDLLPHLSDHVSL